MALDAGTTGIRAVAVDRSGGVVASAYRELARTYPRDGWVEQDPLAVWAATQAVMAELADRLAGHSAGSSGADGRPGSEAGPVVALGLANQRETAIAWDRDGGTPLHDAIVWQDRRTAARCAELSAAGHGPAVGASTGLLLDPYFSATKFEWLLDGDSGGVARRPGLCLGTVDSWLLWNLTEGGVFATDHTNASRTLLYDLDAASWSDDLCELFGVPPAALAEIVPTSGRAAIAATPWGRIPVSALAGDQHAALFGQACFEAGMAKITYGTGTFVLTHAGPGRPAAMEGILTTLAWDLGGHLGGHGAGSGAGSGAGNGRAFALEGSVFTSGAAVQWLRDGLGLISSAPEVESLARSVRSSEGVVVVPAFNGLGSPWWDPWARGVIVGLGRGLGRGHVARAVVESIAFQTRDVLDAMARSGAPVSTVRADGGAAAMDLLLQMQADQLQVPVTRAAEADSTALGAAWMAGLAEGMWSSTAELAAAWRAGRRFDPASSRSAADSRHAGWLRAVERSRGWARPDVAPAP